MTIFIDSSVLCAYANGIDVHHSKAAEIIKRILMKEYGSAIITDYIFDETMTVIMRRTNKKMACDFGRVILNSDILMVRIDYIIFQEAWNLFQKNNNFSFTDCTISAFMNIFKINTIATFDQEFKKFKELKIIGL